MDLTQPQKQRIQSIDTLRGLIMIIMALDHCRDFLHFQGKEYAPTNMATTTVILFFTRWITHYCAPVFVFLSGVSAYLAGLRRSKAELSKFLLTRGLWLILTDVLVITFIFTLNPGYNVIVLEVLWATGFSMILLALLIHTPLWVTACVGCLFFFGHNLLDYLHLPKTGPANTTLTFLLTAFGMIPVGSKHMIAVLYASLPWASAMLLGYVFGSLYRPGTDPRRRKQVLIVAGLALTTLFIVLRWLNAYGNPVPWSVQRNAAHTLLSFLNATKQPPSLTYLSMTLGPALILLSLLEGINTGVGGVKRRLAVICRVYGSVPYFYFVVHLCLIRVINIVLILVFGIDMRSNGSPLVWQAPGFGIPLWAVYLTWVLVVISLYWPCKWFGDYKRANRRWWLSYL
ncbi:MAG TPA: heparan-alpha-glucosaminide N-acetyltransferase domain-containing protein [Puia sp.]|nr:heparan-alpha-glucosaminide N-acetyltransferase domain-containing protein [Puia sp.]